MRHDLNRHSETEQIAVRIEREGKIESRPKEKKEIGERQVQRQNGKEKIMGRSTLQTGWIQDTDIIVLAADTQQLVPVRAHPTDAQYSHTIYAVLTSGSYCPRNIGEFRLCNVKELMM
jgi:hypothetical protein